MRRNWHHGGALDQMKAQFPDAPLPWIDLSTGINPWAYRSAQLDTAIYDQLPTQSAYQDCREAMAAAINAPSDNLCLSPGSEAIIRALPQHLDCPRVAVLDPTYNDHAEVWKQAGSEDIQISDPLALAGQVDAIVVCNPNNPDGRCFDPNDLLAARSALARRGGWLIVDEAYCDLEPAQSLAPHGGLEGLIVLRSFGKFYGLPGLRLGAAVGPDKLCTDLTREFGAWPISTAALRIGAEAYRDQAWQTRTRTALARARALLDEVLRDQQIEIVGGTDLFRFVRVANASRAWRTLARAGIYVRRFDALPDHLRIGLPDSETARARLSDALTLLA